MSDKLILVDMGELRSEKILERIKCGVHIMDKLRFNFPQIMQSKDHIKQ